MTLQAVLSKRNLLIQPCEICKRNRYSIDFLFLDTFGIIKKNGKIVMKCNITGENLTFCSMQHLHEYLKK